MDKKQRRAINAQIYASQPPIPDVRTALRQACPWLEAWASGRPPTDAERIAARTWIDVTTKTWL